MAEIPVLSDAARRRDVDHSGTMSLDELLAIFDGDAVMVEGQVEAVCDPISAGRMTPQAMAHLLATNHSPPMQVLLSSLPSADLQCATQLIPRVSRRWGKAAVHALSKPHQSQRAHDLFSAADWIASALFNQEEYRAQCPVPTRHLVWEGVRTVFADLFPTRPPPHIIVAGNSAQLAYDFGGFSVNGYGWSIGLGHRVICPATLGGLFTLWLIIGHEAGHYYFGDPHDARSHSDAFGHDQIAADLIGLLSVLAHYPAGREWFDTHRDVWADWNAWHNPTHPNHTELHGVIGGFAHLNTERLQFMYRFLRAVFPPIEVGHNRPSPDTIFTDAMAVVRECVLPKDAMQVEGRIRALIAQLTVSK